MKKMELKIILTFALMFCISLIINGIYNLISLDASFFSFEALSIAMLSALVYLVYIWSYTRRHKTLALIGISCSGLLLLFLSCSANGAPVSFEGIATSFGGWDWRAIVMIIYFVIAAFIADYQAEKLLKEDETNS